MSRTAEEKAMILELVAEEERNLGRLMDAHQIRWPDPKPSHAPERSPVPAVNPPSAPGRRPVSEFAGPMLAGIPALYFGEKRVARALAAEQVEEAYEADVEAHSREVVRYELRVALREQAVESRAKELEAEKRLLESAFQRLSAGDRRASELAIVAVLSKAPVSSRLVGWLGGRPVLRVDVPDGSEIPERRPAVTPGGKPTTKKRSQTEVNDALAEVVASVTLAVGRAALSAAPGIEGVEIVAIEPDGAVVAQCALERGSIAKTRYAVDDLLANEGLISQSGRVRSLDEIEIADPRAEDLLNA